MKPRMARQSVCTEKNISQLHRFNDLPPARDASPQWLEHRNSVCLQLTSPTNALVLCAGEASQIQALARTAPPQPMLAGDA